jgi:hypothetical protein
MRVGNGWYSIGRADVPVTLKNEAAKAALRPLIRFFSQDSRRTCDNRVQIYLLLLSPSVSAVLAHQGVRCDRVVRDHYGLP